MTPTLNQIQTWFNEFNAQVFKNALPNVPIKITNNRRQLGQFYWGYDRGIGIKISTYYDAPVDMFRNTLLHEMCHLYCYHRGFLHEHHGKNWQNIARHATNITGLVIERTADISGINPTKKNEKKTGRGNCKERSPGCYSRPRVFRPSFHNQDNEECDYERKQHGLASQYCPPI